VGRGGAVCTRRWGGETPNVGYKRREYGLGVCTGSSSWLLDVTVYVNSTHTAMGCTNCHKKLQKAVIVGVQHRAGRGIHLAALYSLTHLATPSMLSAVGSSGRGALHVAGQLLRSLFDTQP
jgi:hypothetical protein